MSCCWFVSVICPRWTMNKVCLSPISVQPLTVLVDYWFKTEEYPNKIAISSSQLQRQLILSQKADRICTTVLTIWSHSFPFFVCSSLHLCLSCTVAQFHLISLGSTAPFGRPSASLECLYSLSLRVLSTTQPLVAFSLDVDALSLWHSLPQ